MPTSFIHIDKECKKGFWANDGIVEFMLICLINEIELQNLAVESWLSEYKVELAEQAIPLVMGGMSLELVEYINTSVRQQLLVSMIDSILVKFDSDPNYFKGVTLHDFRQRAMEMLQQNEGYWKKEGELERVISGSRWKEADKINEARQQYRNSLVALKQLLLGEIGFEPGDE